MKVVAFNGSPRKQGNTAQALEMVLGEIKAAGIETELIDIAGQGLRGCIACFKCMERKDGKCAITSDSLNEYVQKMAEADGMLIGSPVYFSNVTADVKALIDRAGFVSRSNDNMLQKKVGAPVVVMRRAGATFTFAAINYFFLIQQMIIPGSDYWNVGIGRAPGDVQNDQEGITTFKTLGKNMAWLLQKLQG